MIFNLDYFSLCFSQLKIFVSEWPLLQSLPPYTGSEAAQSTKNCVKIGTILRIGDKKNFRVQEKNSISIECTSLHRSYFKRKFSKFSYFQGKFRKMENFPK